MSTSPEANRRGARKIWREKQDFLVAYRAERGCAKCGEMDIRCLDLHHENQESKHPRLRTRNGRRKSLTGLSWPDLRREVTLCVVLCANCHRKAHYNRSDA